MPNSSLEHEEISGLWVSVDKVEYCKDAQTPPHKPHQFTYYITIHNDSLQVVTIVGRKWLVTNQEGHRLIIEGDGVIGQFPRLAPGDQFHYHSYHIVSGPSKAEGAYLGKDAEGSGVLARIPSFVMKPPED
ncbi:MAG: ApaG domain [Verrucomicrobiota bacterium]